MSRTQTRCAPFHWQSGFLALLPAIRRQAEFALRGYDPEAADDAMSEILAHAAAAYHGLCLRKKQNQAFASVLVRYAIAGYHTGRRTGTATNSNDVYSDSAARQGEFKRISIDAQATTANGCKVLRLRDLLVDNRHTPVADQVAFRIDFAAWLATLTKRDRRIAKQLAMGHTTRDVSQQFDLSPGRISQLRRELAESWNKFVGDTEEYSQAKLVAR